MRYRSTVPDSFSMLITPTVNANQEGDYPPQVDGLSTQAATWQYFLIADVFCTRAQAAPSKAETRSLRTAASADVLYRSAQGCNIMLKMQSKYSDMNNPAHQARALDRWSKYLPTCSNKKVSRVIPASPESRTHPIQPNSTDRPSGSVGIHY